MAKEGRGKILLSLYCHKNYFSCKKTFLLTFFFQDQLILNHMPTSLLSPSFSLSSSPSSPSSSPPSSSLSQQRRQGKNRRKKVQDLKWNINEEKKRKIEGSWSLMCLTLMCCLLLNHNSMFFFFFSKLLSVSNWQKKKLLNCWFLFEQSRKNINK